MGAVIGIDLGTTNSCAAIVRDGKPVVISDTGGSFTIPSVVAIDEKGNRLVGQAAKRQALINPFNTIYGAKRLIGRKFHSKTMETVRRHFTYEMAPGDQDDVLIKLGGEVYGLDEVSALILDKVRNTAQDRLEEEITSAVVTVPAYFNDRQRQAVKDAGVIAQLDVLRIINEPTAAALAYGWGKHMHELVAVYDLGGGTFDISILEVRDNVYEVKATGGDNFLGGVDFDNRLLDYILKEFEKSTGLNLAGDAVAIQRVRDAAERAKIDLSTKTEARVLIPYITVTDNGPVNLDITIKREVFENLVTDLADRTLELVASVLKDAGLTKDRIQEVLLVGGQTRMPYIQKRVEDFFGKPPSKNVHPDEAVAIGAAIMAYSLTEAADYKITLIDVLPMSIGVALAKNRYHRIFPKNSTIPNASSIVFTTSKDNQDKLKLKIYQGENEIASDNELLGEFVFSGLRPAPKGEVHLEVILKLSPEGIMTVEAQDPDTRQKVETTITVTSGITQKTHKTKLIEPSKPAAAKKEEKKEEEKKKEITPPPRRTFSSPTPPPSFQPPSPPPARPSEPKPSAPPRNVPLPPPPSPPPPVEGGFSAVKEKTPPPTVREVEPWAAVKGVQTKVTSSGKVVVRRDPVTGRIIKEDEVTSQQEEVQKQSFKRYKPPPKPPTVGEKISAFFKKIFKR